MATANAKPMDFRLVNNGTLELENPATNPSFRSLLVLSANLLVVLERDVNKLRLHSLPDGKLLATSQRLTSEPWDVCVVDRNGTQVAVTLLGGQIEIMSVESVDIKSERILDLRKHFKSCNGVSALKSVNKLLVSGVMYKKDTKKEWFCWCLVSLQGQVGQIHKISKCITPVCGSYLATSPDDSMVYISCYASNDSPDNGVHIFSVMDGRKQFVYRHSDLPKPTDISVDRRGHIYVCNCDPPCIHQLTPSGERMTIHKEGMPPWPRVICWDEQHGVFYFISGRNKKVWRFQLEWIEQQVLPPEILNMDEMSQRLYREALAAGMEKVYNIRVMIVGHQGVGKTSLTQRLLGEQVKENETESTEGIEVHARCCHIDHATQEWQLKVKTDEDSLNDQRIANILSKYVSPRNSQAVVEVLATDAENDVTPSTPTAGTLCQESEAAHIRKTDGSAPISQLNNRVQKENVQDEAQERICSAEIKNLVERTQSLPLLKSESSYVTFLDFAGQSLFYSTHQAFMSWRTLYLLVTDMSLPLTDTVEEGAFVSDVSGTRTCSIQEYVTYWLNSIHSHVLIPEDDRIHREGKSARREEGGAQGTKSNHPFVILVGTHSDKIPEKLLDQKKKSYFNDIRVDMKDRPFLSHLVDEDFAISNLGSDPTINELKSKIFETAQNQLYWGEEIPARWICLERALMELKKRIPVIEYADVKSLNETLQVQIERPEELDLFLRFEHDMGNIVFFNTERLRSKVVLDPKWLIHGVRTWITSDQVIKRHSDVTAQWDHFKKTGQLTRTLIEKLWSSHSEIHQHKEHLLDVMEKLNIIVKPLQMEEEYYWVPCMVSIPAPDYIKKLQQKKDTTKTSTLCFRSKTNFIHVGVFHRLIAICLSKWMPAKEGEAYLLFRGLCVFDIDEQQQLLLSLNDFVIHAIVIRFTKQGRIPDLYICMAIRDYLHTALSEISDYLCPGSKFETCIQCNKSSPLTNEGLHSITTLRTKDEIKCSYHKETHCVESGTLLGFWEEVKKQIPEIVLPQQSHKTKETRTGICDSLLRKLSKDLISHKWRFFFRELSVTDNELDEVEINYRDVHEQIYQLLCRMNQGGRLNKSSIIQALQSVGRNDLIDKYSNKDFNLS